MSNTDEYPYDLSGGSSNLPAAAAATSAVDRNSLVKALKEKLQHLAGRHSDIMETLSPPVKKRVEVLQELQGEYDELEAKFIEERAALEDKYDTLYEPLYSKRYEIVNAVVEVDGITELAKDEEGDNEGEGEKGVPNFWLFVLKTNEVVGEVIEKRDQEALKYLKDIKRSRIGRSRGSFKLEFFFDANPFFKNSVLTKTYIMENDDESVLRKSIGTQIEWLPSKCLTTKILRKKPKKGSKNVKPMIKVVKCESFFKFFNPPQLPDDDDELDVDTAEDLQNLVEHDYDIGTTIRNKIIPNAVSWFTGEAVEDDTIYVHDGDDSDDDNEEDEEDDDLPGRKTV